ncbi:MAG: pseudoazurin [Pseudomonadota bacterium]
MRTRRNFIITLGAVAAGSSAALACPAPVVADRNHKVLMLNAACGDPDRPNVFEPALLRINVGDSVTFLAMDEGHNTASKRGMVPDGATSWNGGLDEEKTITFDVPGVYGYICLPHYEVGMVGLIAVGDDLPNLKAAKKVRHPGKARRAFRALFKQLEVKS